MMRGKALIWLAAVRMQFYAIEIARYVPRPFPEMLDLCSWPHRNRAGL